MRLALFFFLLGSVVTLIAGGDRTRMNHVCESVANVLTAGLDVVTERIDAYRSGGADRATPVIAESSQPEKPTSIEPRTAHPGKPTPIAAESGRLAKPTPTGWSISDRHEVHVETPINVSQMRQMK